MSTHTHITYHSPRAYTNQPTKEKRKMIDDTKRDKARDMELVHTRTGLAQATKDPLLRAFGFWCHPILHQSLSTTLWPSSLFSRDMGRCIGTVWIGFGGYSHTAAGHPATDRLEVPSRYRPELEKHSGCAIEWCGWTWLVLIHGLKHEKDQGRPGPHLLFPLPQT